jgi:hypothetical protein
LVFGVRRKTWVVVSSRTSAGQAITRVVGRRCHRFEWRIVGFGRLTGGRTVVSKPWRQDVEGLVGQAFGSRQV